MTIKQVNVTFGEFMAGLGTASIVMVSVQGAAHFDDACVKLLDFKQTRTWGSTARHRKPMNSGTPEKSFGTSRCFIHIQACCLHRMLRLEAATVGTYTRKASSQ